MTKIRARCPRCGDVEFSLAAIVVVGTHDGPSRTYRFSCPACERAVTRSALPEVIDLLLSAGVRLAEAPAARSPRPRITDREVKAFRALLDRPDWFSHLEAFDRDGPAGA